MLQAKKHGIKNEGGLRRKGIMCFIVPLRERERKLLFLVFVSVFIHSFPQKDRSEYSVLNFWDFQSKQASCSEWPLLHISTGQSNGEYILMWEQVVKEKNCSVLVQGVQNMRWYIWNEVATVKKDAWIDLVTTVYFWKSDPILIETALSEEIISLHYCVIRRHALCKSSA